MTIDILFDLNKSLEELEGDIWGKPNFNSSLVTKCHDLRKKPVSNLSIEDMRLLISQDISLDYLIPLAIEEINGNPFVQGNMFPGDLLKSILSVRKNFWEENPIYYSLIKDILESAIDDLNTVLKQFVKDKKEDSI